MQNQLVLDLLGYVNRLQNQIKLFSKELGQNELHHSPACKEINEQHLNANFVHSVHISKEIKKQFVNRFQDFAKLSKNLIISNNL